MLTVYNVMQGDSMLLSGTASRRCCFGDEPLLIDCGSQKATVHSKIGAKPQRLRVLVTHADNDHIGGLYDVLANHHASRLYIPRYLPEIQRIEDYLRRKAARKSPVLPRVSAGRRIEVAEGDRLCSHSLVMNPPKLARKVLNALGVRDVPSSEVQNAVNALQSRGLGLPVADIMEYMPEPIDTRAEGDAIQRGPSASAPRFRERRSFFQGFFIYLAQRLQGANDTRPVDAPEREDFEPTEDSDINSVISAALQLAANQVSIVFRYDGTKSFLFTGDADTSVFQRMLSQGHPLAAEYLKVPHHGSRHNLDGPSLGAVSPKIAVVSHGNARFGRDPDTHPHMATMNLLSLLGVTTYYTNNVEKAGRILVAATRGKTLCKYLDFK